MDIGTEDSPIELPLPTVPERAPSEKPSEVEPSEVEPSGVPA